MPNADFILRRKGFTVYLSKNIVDTISITREKKPDVVVLRPSGEPIPSFEIEAVLEALTPHQYFVLSMLTNPNGQDVTSTCSRADDFFVGPNPEELATRIRVLTQRIRTYKTIDARLKKLERESITDFKTELFNDRYILTRLDEEIERANRHRLVLSAIMLDFDEFKQVNDTLGHAFGDFVLLSFARKLKSLIRRIDIPGRLGGDEFLILLPNTDLDEAVRIADRIRSIVNDYKFEKDGVSAALTVSLGINATPGDGSLSGEEFLKGADMALIEAKRRGKNRIFLFPQLKMSEKETIPEPPEQRTETTNE